MAAVKLYLDKRSQKKDETFPLKMLISHRGEVLLSLGISILENQWENNIICNHPKKSYLNKVLSHRLLQANNIILELKKGNRINRISAKELKSYIEAGTINEQPQDEPALFKTHYEKYISYCTKKRTAEIYQSTLNRISQFADIDNLKFEDITFSWLKEFDAFLKENAPSTNARSIHFKNIRTVYNDAVNEDIISLTNYPFRKFKIKYEKTKPRTLTEIELAAIRDTKWISKKTDNLQCAADVFMLSFYLMGINIVDLMHLKRIEKTGRIEYIRSKTNKHYSVKVPKEALKIIEKYKGENHLLEWIEQTYDYRKFSARTNIRLRRIAKTINVDELTTYYARHSWATIASKINIPKETIAAALGHGGNSVTDIYIDFDYTKVDKANEAVIRHINKTKAIKK